jgi:CO dehydrogenase/acetyl-CoA synthase alpha subunit
MSTRSNRLQLVAGALLTLSLFAAPLAAQGNGKRYAVSNDKAVTVTREVLVRRGFEVVKVETKGDTRTIYYRAGNQGRGKGKGKLERMVIRREADRVVFVETPAAILVDIDLKLKL